MSISKEPTLTSSVVESTMIGDAPTALPTQNSADSLASTLFPWRTNFRNITGNRRALIARYESGRTITSIGFYLCLMSILLLCTGVGLAATSIYLLIYRIPYVHITDGAFHSEAINFTLCAAVISVLCWWIGWIAHDNKKNYIFLPLLIVILALSLSMLLTAVGIGFVQKSRLVFNRTIKPPKLSSSHYKTLLNEALNSTLKLYDENDSYRNSWNHVQQRLNCCGIIEPSDWAKNNKDIPWSCYLNHRCPDKRKLVTDGCFDKIAHEFDWENCLLIGLSMITFCVQMVTMFLVCGVYIGDKIKKNSDNNNNTNCL